MDGAGDFLLKFCARAWNLIQTFPFNMSSMKRKLDDPAEKTNVARVTRRKMSAEACDEPRPSTSENQNLKTALANCPFVLKQTPNNSRLAIESKPDSFKATDKLDPANSQLVLYKPLVSDRPAMSSAPPALVKECFSLKSKVSTRKETIRDLGSQLQKKQQEVEMLKQQLYFNTGILVFYILIF